MSCALLASTPARAATNAATTGANCNVFVGGRTVSAVFRGDAPSDQATISSATSEIFSISFTQAPEVGWLVIGIHGINNYMGIQGRGIRVLRNGLDAAAVGHLDTGPTTREGVTHLEFQIQASNSATDIRVSCDRQMYSPDQGVEEGTYGPPPLGVHPVSFTTPDVPSDAVR